MDSSISDDVPLSAVDSELPDMVPVSIRTKYPEFQHYSLERVLAGLLLTWQEFLQLFDIRVEAKDYYILGSNGVKSDLNQRIGDYVSTFRRKLKVYPVTLERVNHANETNKRQRLSTESNGSKGDNVMDNPKSGSPSAKKLKLMDQDKSRRNHRKTTKETLAKIAQSVIQEQSTVTGTKRPSITSTKKESKRGSVKSRSPTPPTNEPVNVDAASNSSDSHSVKASDSIDDPSKIRKLSADQSQLKNAIPSTSSGVVKRGRKPRKSLKSRRSTKESIVTTITQESNVDSSESDDIDEVPTKDKKKLLKQRAIKYLTDKVSPRSFLRLRNELMNLRDQEKYFKVTTIVPISAGMMEQAFCRKLTE